MIVEQVTWFSIISYKPFETSLNIHDRDNITSLNYDSIIGDG